MRSLAFLFLLFFTQNLFAQGGAGQKLDMLSYLKGHEVTVNVGRLLPNQISGVTEILPLWGLKYGHSLGAATFEGGFIGGNGEGVSYNSLHVSLRGNIPVEDIVGLVYIGTDFVNIRNVSDDELNQGSGHFGAGIMTPVVPNIWFRGDMKFNSGPGTSMYISLGLTFLLGEGQNQ